MRFRSYLDLLQSQNQVFPSRLACRSGSEQVSELAVRELVNATVRTHREIPPNARGRLELDALDSSGRGLEALFTTTNKK